MEEVPAIFKWTEIFVGPISFIIKSVGMPVHCNDVVLQLPRNERMS
jgi:hypothetical protein